MARWCVGSPNDAKGTDATSRSPLRFVALAAAIALASCGVAIKGEYHPAPETDAGAPVDAGAPIDDVSPDPEEDASSGGPTDAGLDADGAGPPPPHSVGASSVASDSLTIDRVRNTDGAITSDGVNDGVFEVDLVGPATAIAIIRTDGTGEPCCAQQWDTWVGADVIPADLDNVFTVGSATYHVAVYEGGVLQNDAAGRVSLPSGPHSIRLVASNVGSFVSGEHFRIVLQTLEGTLVRGPVVSY